MPAILAAGLTAGALDITSVFLLYAPRGIFPVRICQSVASGLLGPRSFTGGLTTAALGLFLHFVIALGAATVFYLASRRLPFLVQKAIISGVLYGLAIYLFMNFIVLPLSATRPQHFTVFSVVTQLLIHMLLIGPAIALIVRRFSARSLPIPA
ncbi:MAG: hypothetical protein ACR2HH_05625 [Chthoniobacterales bacterium]